MPSKKTLCLILAAASTTAVTAATAATPESGTISSSSPRVTWTGSTTASYTVLNPMANSPEDTPCEAPTCDTFALTLADSADLQVANERVTESDDVVAGIRITEPDGDVVYGSGPSKTGKPFKLKIKAAPKGDYKIDLVNNSLGTAEYNGLAELLIAGAAAPPAPTPGATPAPAPSPTPAPAPAPAPAESFTVTVKAPKIAAKKVNRSRKLSVGVTVSREVQKVVAQLKRGKAVVAKGQIGRLARSGKVILKLSKKLKPGAHTLVVSATDARGTTVVKTVRVKARR